MAKKWNDLSDAKKKPYEKMAQKDAKSYVKKRLTWEAEVKKLGGIPEDVIRERREAKKRSRNKIKKPKGPRNAYVLYSMAKRKELVEEGLSFQEMTTRIASEWKKIKAKEQAKFKEEAKRDKERFDKEMEAHRLEHPEQELKKNRKRRKQKGEPKSIRNAYIFFSVEERTSVKAEKPDMEPKEIMSELGKRWNKLSEKGRAKYAEMAANDKERYVKEMKEWRTKQEA